MCSSLWFHFKLPQSIIFGNLNAATPFIVLQTSQYYRPKDTVDVHTTGYLRAKKKKDKKSGGFYISMALNSR